MSGRERDKGRKYPSGAAKRRKIMETENEKKNLPKISSFIKSTPPSVGNSKPGNESEKKTVEKSGIIPSETAPPTIDNASTSNAIISKEDFDADAITSKTYEDDIGLWPEHLSEDFKNYWIEKGSSNCRHVDSEYKNSEVHDGNKILYCTRSLFTRKHSLNGEEIDLSWLCYSKKTGRVFCFTCCIMSSTKSRFTIGFQDWKHARESVEAHSNSDPHKQAVSDLAIRKSQKGHVNMELVRQYESQQRYWYEVLRRCVDVLTFLCERGLPVRGDDEVIGSVNNGNYLGIMELLSKYDPFLASHIEKHANQRSGHVNYLSSTICNELIEVMGKKVLCAIVAEVQKAKYYSISVDSTPDISHIDQLCVTIRYVLPEGPVECFLTYVPLLNHTGQEIADVVLDFLQNQKIPISDCRGQSYDNASNMSGKYRGTQALIKMKCEFAEFTPCMAHSLNLVGTCAAECCTGAVTLFGLIQRLYVYLVKSTYRWRKHRDAVKQMPVVKCLSDTRWSARADAVQALTNGYQQNTTLLEDLSVDEHLNAEAKCEASGILKELKRLETVLLLETWRDILIRFNATSQQLQTPGLDLNTAVKLIESLKTFIQDLRGQFDHYEQIAIKKCGHSEYEGAQRRVQKRKRHHDEVDSAEDTQLSPRERFRTTSYLPIFYQLSMSLDERLQSYSTLNQRFGFLADILNIKTEKLRESAANLARSYPFDLEDCLVSEMVHFQAFLQTLDNKTWTEINMYSTIHKYEVASAFPNVEIALRIYLSMFVTNCTGERSFSKLKRIKSSLRSTLSQSHLTSLAILSAEHEIFRNICTCDVIEDFAQMKSRRKIMV